MTSQQKIIKRVSMKEKHMVDTDHIRVKLKSILKKERYKHTVGVEEEAIRLSKMLGLNPEPASIAALLHDITKDLSESEHRALLLFYRAPMFESLYFHKMYHGITGALIAQNVYGICNIGILNSIKYHSVPRPEMTVLEKIIFLADTIEKNRKDSRLSDIRILSTFDFDKAVLAALELNAFDEETKHPDMSNRFKLVRDTQLYQINMFV